MEVRNYLVPSNYSLKKADSFPLSPVILSFISCHGKNILHMALGDEYKNLSNYNVAWCWIQCCSQLTPFLRLMTSDRSKATRETILIVSERILHWHIPRLTANVFCFRSDSCTVMNFITWFFTYKWASHKYARDLISHYKRILFFLRISNTEFLISNTFSRYSSLTYFNLIRVFSWKCLAMRFYNFHDILIMLFTI